MSHEVKVNNENRTSNEVFSADQAQRAGFQVRDVMKDDFGFEVRSYRIG